MTIAIKPRAARENRIKRLNYQLFSAYDKNVMTNDQAELFQYYEERAPEYQAFYRGEFPVAFPHPERYRQDTLAISRLMGESLSGRCLDLACGTAFWLPYYHAGCSRITLGDQSDAVLDKARAKIAALGITERTEVLRADIFRHDFPTTGYDAVNVGFLISHFTDDELARCFALLRRVIAPGSRLPCSTASGMPISPPSAAKRKVSSPTSCSMAASSVSTNGSSPRRTCKTSRIAISAPSPSATPAASSFSPRARSIRPLRDPLPHPSRPAGGKTPHRGEVPALLLGARPFPDDHPIAQDENGHYLYLYLDLYWREDVRLPYLLLDDGKIAGFAFVRHTGKHWEMAEFYVKRVFRRRGLGRTCATLVVVNHPGAWRILFNKRNRAGRALWTCLVEDRSGGRSAPEEADRHHDSVAFTAGKDTRTV